jgi:hypothetical protein
LGAGALVEGLTVGAAAGFGAGFGGAVTSDIAEVAGTGTKELQDVSVTNWFVSGGVGAVLGAPLGGAGALGANLNPNIGALQALDRTVVGRATTAMAGGLETIATRSAQAGSALANKAVTIVESAPPPGLAADTPPPISRARAIREALSDSRGRLLPRVERSGIKSTIRSVEEQGYELLGSVKYRGNQGIDLSFRGTNANAGRFALAEAKTGASRGTLGRDTLGIRQGGYEYARSRLARGIVYGDPAKRAFYRELYGDLRAGNVDLFAGFAASDRLFLMDPTLFNRDVNFLATPGASVRVK